MHTLQGWQKTRHAATSALVQRAGVAALLVCLLAGIALVLRLPYERPTLHLAVLAPGAIADPTHQSTSLTNRSLHGSSAHDHDAAAMWCQASGRHVSEMVRAKSPQLLIKLSGSQLKQQAHMLTAEASSSCDGRSTLIVYVNGVLSLEHKQPAVCASGHEAIHGGGELPLLPLVETLQQMNCQQVLLCLDLVPPSIAAPAVIASPLLVDELLESIEQSLSLRHERTPLAVCVHLNSVDSVADNGWNTTPLAAALASCLQTELSGSQFDLHRLKSRLAGDAQRRGTATDQVWLTSVHWPANSELIRLPKGKPKSNREANVDIDGVASYEANELLTQSPRSMESVDVAQCDVEQLWRLGKAAIASLGTVPIDRTLKTPTAWLPIPQPLSYRQRHPFAAAWLEQLWEEWETAHRLAVNEPALEELRAMVKCLVSLAHGDPLPAELSPRQRVALRASRDLQVDATCSLLVNVTLARLATMDDQVAVDSLALLGQLTQTIDESSSALQCKAAIEQLTSSRARQLIELELCRDLCQSRAPWSTLQRVLRLQLISLRAEVDLFQDAPAARQTLREAEQCWHEVQRDIVLLSQDQTNDAIGELTDRAMALYGNALDCMAQVERTALEHNIQLGHSLKTHAWTDQRGASLKASQTALQLFADQWQELIRPSAIAHESASPPRQRALKLCDQIADTRRMLSDASIAREKQIEAILWLNRNVLSAAESVMTHDNKNDVVDSNAPGGLECGAIGLFLSLAASDRTKPLQSWIDERLSTLVQLNADRLAQQLQGATSREQTTLQPQQELWSQLTVRLQSQGVPVVKQAPSSLLLSVDAPEQIDVQPGHIAALPCDVTYQGATHCSTQLTARYDDNVLQIKLDNQSLRSGQSIDLRASAVDRPEEDPQAQSKTHIVLSVHRLASKPIRQPIVLLVSQGGTERRAVVHVSSSRLPLVEVQLSAAGASRAVDSSGAAQSQCVLMPNRLQSIELAVKNRRPSSLDLAVRVWAAGSSPNDLPTEPLEQSAAEEWFHRYPDLVPLAEATTVRVEQQASQNVRLAPAVGVPDFKQQPFTCAGVIVGITDASSKQVQLEYREFHARHPRSYVQQQVVIDPERRSIEAVTKLQEPLAGSAVIIQHRLVDWPQCQVRAQADGLLTADIPQSRRALSSVRGRTDHVALLTDVDQWRSALVQVIDRGQNRIVDEPTGHVALSSSIEDGILSASSAEAAVSVNAWASVPAVDDRIALQIGWDRNHDRTFQAEPSLRMHDVQSIRACYEGLDASGAMLVECRVEPLRVSLPLDGLTNQRASVLAILCQGEQVLARSELTIVVDQQAPAIIRTDIDGGTHCLLGAPLTLNVDTNDHGLSGVARVEAAWSLDGRLQLTDSMKPLPSVLRPDGSWKVALPTESLPVGDNTVLLRAIDKAGNCSETYRFIVRLHTQQELDELAASVTSSVTGWLMFVRLPQAGVNVELLKTPPDEKAEQLKDGASSKESSEANELPVVATTTSLVDGSFRFDAVPSGQYIIRISGIVRGMRTEQSQKINVKAPQHVAPIVWRLDKQP